MQFFGSDPLYDRSQVIVYQHLLQHYYDSSS